MLKIGYRESDFSALVSWDQQDDLAQWNPLLSRLLFDSVPVAKQEGPRQISVPWWNFVALRGDLQAIFAAYQLIPGQNLAVSEAAAELLRKSRRSVDGYSQATTSEPIPTVGLLEQLGSTGFHRALSNEQLRNVAKIAGLPAAATFSVPGAGKTTEALAYYFYRSKPGQRLLVVAPKNAFAAWDEQILKCVPSITQYAPQRVFVRLRGGRERIERLLDLNPRFTVISYQQLALIPDVIAAYCARHDVFVFLDESHRIKSGLYKPTARAVLTLSHLPVGKVIMSGTPMPQEVGDLIPQFSFLYPEIEVSDNNVVELIKRVYVRTNKQELGLKPPDRAYVPLYMAPLQAELYKLMKFEVARDAAAFLQVRQKQTFRTLGRSVNRLLQFVSNPALLSSHIAFAHPDLLAAVLEEGSGPKLKYVLSRARNLTNQGHKVLIWSSFVQNVEYIAQRLSDLGAVYIHGEVEAGEETDDETREGKIRLFHDDPNVMVMVANPAAASEGISLHEICHHAIYLDRTFNAAHYLQSEDRIHRFGLSPEQSTQIEIVECVDTVDETVRTRLSFKINQMAAVLEDSSLTVNPVSLEPSQIEGYDTLSGGLGEDDIAQLLRDIGVDADG